MQEQESHFSTILEYISSFLIKLNIRRKDDFMLQVALDKEKDISPEILLQSIETLKQQLEFISEIIKSGIKDKKIDVSTIVGQEKTIDNDVTYTASEQIVNTECESHPIDSNIVQIKASNDEVERRIAAFLEQKQSEVNEFNRREFCSGTQLEYSDGCARTEAVFVPRAGTKSHIKVTRVVNPYGPQTRHHDIESCSVSTSQAQQANAESGLQCMHERLKNIENHLSMAEEPSKGDMFQRVKLLEERILYLEGLSPEYFQNAAPPMRKHRKVETIINESDPHMEITLIDIDAKIQRLKTSLKRQSFGDGLG